MLQKESKISHKLTMSASTFLAGIRQGKEVVVEMKETGIT